MKTRVVKKLDGFLVKNEKAELWTLDGVNFVENSRQKFDDFVKYHKPRIFEIETDDAQIAVSEVRKISLSEYEAKQREIAAEKAYFNSLSEVARIDCDGQKLKLMSDGRIYRHERYIGWILRPLNEWSSLAIKARKASNRPLDKANFSPDELKMIEDNEQYIFGQMAKNKEIDARHINEEQELLKNQPIETTVDNLILVMRHLLRSNWGSWELPEMTIGYRAAQYDCDGVTAITVCLDEPISDEEHLVENETMFSYGNPNRYLKKYRRLR
jgi:hypothetical protein